MFCFMFPQISKRWGLKKNFDPHLQNRGAALGLPPQLRNAHTWYKTFQTSYVAVTNKTVKQ